MFDWALQQIMFGLFKNVQSKSGEAISTDNIRDRDTRREDILPALSKSHRTT